MNGSWRMLLGVLLTALALTVFGCFTSSQLTIEIFGQGGGNTSAASTTATSRGTGGAGGMGGVPCSSMSPCEDDKNPCTTEECKNGFCVSTLLTMDPAPGSTECMTLACTHGAPTKTIHGGDPCGKGLKCNAQGGCSGCKNDAACGETNACQTSKCLPEMTCEYVFQPIGTPVVPALSNDLPKDCMSTICNGSGVIALAPDAADVPDAMPCHDVHCVNGKPVQTPLPVSTPCTGGTKFCNAAQSCVVCAVDADCKTVGTTCYQQMECVSCMDTKMNGDETDVDCGGTCGATCKDGKVCKDAGDCEHNLCAAGLCVSCFDGVKNNGEVGVDCGGLCALKCPDATPCTNDGDCNSGNCTDKVCCAVTCTGACTACNLPTKVGICVQLAKGHDDTAPLCSGTKTCDSGVCVGDMNLKHFCETCTTGTQCFSGTCGGSPLACQ